MMERSLRLYFILGLLPFLGGCGFYHEKPSKDLSLSFPGNAAKFSYQTVRQRVFIPNCVLCHGDSGGVNLESYAAIKANLSKIEKAVFVDKTMPKSRPLGATELKILAAWIKAGAPETTEGAEPDLPGTESPVPSASPSPGPTNPTDPIEPSFVSIKKRILDSKCISCHSEGGTASGVPLKTLKDLLNSPRELVIPKNPDESGLWIAVSRPDSKRMPPPSAGMPLSSGEVGAIRKWIEIGAPENTGDPPSEGGSGPGGEPPQPIDGSKLLYPLLREKVFAPRCISCHGNAGGVSLETYTSIKANLAKIAIVTLVEKSMPKSSPLPKAESDLLAAWIKAGGPESSGSEPIPSPSPSPSPIPEEPLKPTFTSLKKRVFESKCISCHSGSSPRGDISFESLKDLLKSSREPLKMEDDGDPDTSGLVIAITRKDAKRMPPPNAGSALSDTEIEVIKKWVKEGAME